MAADIEVAAFADIDRRDLVATPQHDLADRILTKDFDADERPLRPVDLETHRCVADGECVVEQQVDAARGTHGP